MVNGIIRYVITVTGLCWCISLPAQKQVADSIGVLLAHEKQDSNKVTLLWNQAIAYNRFNPDSSILLAQKGLVLARRIKFIPGESKSLGVLANAFEQIGNYPKSLEYFLLKLKLEEDRDNPLNMASVLLSIGSVYVLQEEYENALNYYFKADSVMKNNVEGDPKFGFQLRYSIALNIGDLYNRINRLDSAYIFFQRSYDISKEQVNRDYTGMSMVGIGEVYLKQKEYEKSKKLFISSLPYFEESNNDDLICEVSWGLANLYDSLGRNDSAKYYAQKMFLLSQKDGLLTWELKASDLLGTHYKKMKQIDSAYAYRLRSQQLKDSINSRQKIRESQVISSNEQIRQAELADQKQKARKERKQQLQFLFIGIFIPALFLMTLILSRRKVNVRIIKFLGILSLLILFEYLTLLLHPYVLEITNHTPIFELMIFVVIAGFLIRAHHQIEQWFINKLINQRNRFGESHIRTKRIKIKMKRPSE